MRTPQSWSHLIATVGVLRALAATAGFAPAWVLSRGPLGPGTLAGVGGALATVGLLGGVLWWRSTGHLRRIALLLLVAVHAVTLLLFPPHWLLEPLQAIGPRFFTEASRDEFALTIDDGLDPATTPQVLETLARHGARATFFVFGSSLEKHPELARRCLAEGHELANHQMDDTPAVALAPDELQRQMEQTNELLSPFTTPRWFRPGGGIVTERAEQVAERLRTPIALGSVFPFDSHLPSARFITAYVEARARAGDIVVLHDGGERGQRTAKVLDAALPRLAEKGLRAVTLSELIEP